MCPEVCTPKQFSQATGMSVDEVRRKCESGEFEHAEKVGSRWFINFDRTMGRAAPSRTQPIDEERLAGLIASMLFRALSDRLGGSVSRLG